MEPPEHVTLHSAEEFKAELAKGAGARLLPVRKELAGVEIKAEADGAMTFTLSTPAVDRSGDVVMQEGWKTDAYQKNPIVLWAHDYRQPPVARSPVVGLENGALVARGVQFVPRDVHEFGWSVGEMYRRGFLNAVSVGFRPLKWNFNEDRKGAGGVDFQEQELLEWSAVPVPANPEALIGAKAAGIPLAPIVEWAEKILDSRDPAESERLLVPREYVERLWAIANPKALVQVPAAKAEGDGMAAAMNALAAALTANTAALQACTEACVRCADACEEMTAAMLEDDEPAEPEPGKAEDSSDAHSAESLASVIAAETRRQVEALLGH